ncbi:MULTISPECIES: hypothetical protein [Flavobacterium]|uniref:hypothetical protein n=1 Tax=Flavobacterium TaxID=237 RepID=UPI001FCC5806|nr:MULTISPECIES: hypothetical protein [Flavobacterium]UOK41964.1 hypothetical protein LZF87_11685 [Flavobacterium enshiense]
MGKLKGILQLTGNFDGLSFYEANGKIIVRKTGGFNGEKIKNDSNYVLVRENSTEFAQSAKAGKYFRNGIAKYLKPLHIPYVHNAVVQLFQEITKLDTNSERGKRTVTNGLVSEEAKQLIAKFEFNKASLFSSFFPFKTEIDAELRQLAIKQFTTDMITKPKGATHMALTFFTLGLDFEKQTQFQLQESAELLFDFSNDATTPTDLLLPSAFSASPAVFGFLSVRFLQEVNGELNRLAGGNLKIVGAI